MNIKNIFVKRSFYKIIEKQFSNNKLTGRDKMNLILERQKLMKEAYSNEHKQFEEKMEPVI